MKYQGDIGLYLSGMPVPLKECAIYITQPKVRDIVQFGEADFLTAVQLLTKTDEFLKELKMGNPRLKSKSDFQLLMIVLQEDQSVRQYMDTFFELVFPNYKILYEDNSLKMYLREDEEKRISGLISSYTFPIFQRTIGELFSCSSEEEAEFNPANESAKAIAEKLKKARSKRSEENGSENQNTSLFGTYASILAIGMHMDVNIFFNYTPFQIIDSFRRYWEKDKHDFYRKVASTPLMDVSQMEEPKEWTRNLYPHGNN